MLRIAGFATIAVFVTIIGSGVAAAQSSDRPASPAARPTAAPPPPPFFTPEQKRANTYKTYPPGYAGCVEDLGYGRVKYGCGGE